MKIPFIKVPWDVNISKFAPVGISSAIDVGFSNWGLELVNISLYVFLILYLYFTYKFFKNVISRYTMTKSTAIIFVLINALILRLEKPVSESK